MTEPSSDELAAVATCLRQAGVAVAGPLRTKLLAGGRSNVTYRLDDDLTSWVLRMPPRTGRTPSAHDVAREHRVTSALRSAPVPVAEPLVLCENDAVLGCPFTVCAFVPGATIRTQQELDRLDGAALVDVVDALIDTLATLHSVDHVAAGLERFGRPDGYAQRQVARWAAQWDIVSVPEHRAFGERVAARLAAAAPPQGAAAIVHGDFRIDNTLLDFSDRPPRVAAVVDWELSTIGDPIADVAMMCAYRDPAFDLIVGSPAAWTSDRLPSVPQLAAMYESAGGRRLKWWEFHLALAYFKVAAIAAGIDHRSRAGAAVGNGFGTAGESVARFLHLADTAL